MNETVNKQYLIDLMACAEDACVAATNHKHRFSLFPNGATNWVNLHCVNAERYQDVFNNDGYRVWIEECSPLATELNKFIREYLEKHDFKNVDVVFEW